MNFIGKGEGEQRYLSVAEVRTLFRRAAIARADSSRDLPGPPAAPSGPRRLHRQVAVWLIAFALVAKWVANSHKIRQNPFPRLARAICCRQRYRTASGAKKGLARTEWTTEMTWFHPASQGHRDFPGHRLVHGVEQRAFTCSRPRLLRDSAYLERFGFLPKSKNVHADTASLRRLAMGLLRPAAGGGARNRSEVYAARA